MRSASWAGPGLHREHDREHRPAQVRRRRQRGATRRGATRVARGFLAGSAIGGVLAVTTAIVTPSMSLARSGSRSGFSSAPRSWPRQRRPTGRVLRRRGHRGARAGRGRAQRHRQTTCRSRPDDHRSDDDARRSRRRLAPRRRLGQGLNARITAVLAMLTGALAGALLLKISFVPPLLAAAGHRAPRGARLRAVRPPGRRDIPPRRSPRPGPARPAAQAVATRQGDGLSAVSSRERSPWVVVVRRSARTLRLR